VAGHANTLALEASRLGPARHPASPDRAGRASSGCSGVRAQHPPVAPLGATALTWPTT